MTTPNQKPSPSKSSGERRSWPAGLDDEYRDPFVHSDPEETYGPVLDQFKKEMRRILREHQARKAGPA